MSNKCAVAAAIQFKQVFCFDNVSLAIHEPQLTKFLAGLGIRVISCFEVKARETAWQCKNLEEPDHRTFRVCINRGDTDLLLNSDNLPSDTVISRWQFKHDDKPTVIDNELARRPTAAAAAVVVVVVVVEPFPSVLLYDS